MAKEREIRVEIMGAHAKRKLCGERTSNEVSEPCRLRRGKGYGVCEDEVRSYRRLKENA